MNRVLTILMICVFSCCLRAQVVDTTVCDILKNPKSFNGKMVRIKGTVSAGFDLFIVKGAGCGQHVDGIWLSYPEGTRGKAGPVAILQLQPARNFGGTVASAERAQVSLERNKNFKQFDALLSAPYKGGGICLGCGRNVVDATLVGRLDGIEVGLHRDSTGKIVGISGFGNMNTYGARLVLQSVSEVSPQEIEYSKPALAAGKSTTLAEDFGSGSSLKDQLRRAVQAFGGPGEDNGVNVGFGVANEASQKDEAKGSHDSPDGVLFNCTFDGERLKGELLQIAMTHLGEHIADIRNPEPGMTSSDAYQLEFRAWVTTVLGARAGGQKSLMLPGGYPIWSSAWAQADLSSNTQIALASYLVNEAMLAK